jgi:MFS family permease
MSADEKPDPLSAPPDDEHPATYATEQQIETEMPTVRALDQSPAPPAHDPYAALRIGNYRLYTTSYSLAVVGGQVQNTALAWQIYNATGSKLSLGFIGGIQVIPLILLSLPAGHLSDTVSRKRLLMATQWLLALWGVVLAYLAYAFRSSPWLVNAMFGVILLNAVTLTFARPARASLLPTLVPSDVFANAVTWNSTIFELSMIGGPAIGGLVLWIGGPALAYFVNGMLLVACVACTSRFPDRAVEKRDEAPGFAALLAGVKFVLRHKLMLATMTLDLFAVLLGGAVYLLPAFAKDILNVGPWGFGWLRAAPSFGALSMALISAHRPPMKRAGRALLLAVAGFGAATIVFGLSRHFALAFVMLVLTGAFDNISVVVRHTLVQLLTPDSMRGRVSAVNQVFIGSSNELGGFESGVTAAWWGTVRAIVIGGMGTILTVGAIAALFPALRKLGRLDEVKPEADDDRLSSGKHDLVTEAEQPA